MSPRESNESLGGDKTASKPLVVGNDLRGDCLGGPENEAPKDRQERARNAFRAEYTPFMFPASNVGQTTQA